MAKTIHSKFLRSLLLLTCFALFCCLCGCGNGETTGTDTTTTTTTTTTASLTLSIPSSVVTFGTPVTVTATLTDANGAVVPNALVTFTAADTTIVTFSPTSGTALTDASGVASITLNAASIDSTGATSITASAQLDTSTTVTSIPVGIAVNGTAITLGALTLGTPSISSYGTSSVSVPVLIDGAPATVPISVTFTSSCVSAGKATLSSPVTTVSGTATSTYKDNNCASGTDLITASVTGASASATITVALPATSNIQFVSATPEIIGTSTAGATTLSKNSVVKFKVVDSSNNGKAGVLVDFSLIPASAPGGITFSPASATSDADGYVTTTVTSGTVPTPLWVVATVNGTSIKSQSNALTITTGLPTQNFFSLSASTHNIEGWNYDGVTSTLTVIASDRLGNPVPDGTAINFITEGAQITPASCTTTGGTCTVTFKSSAYRPIDETTTAHSGNGAVAAFLSDGVTPITITYFNGTNSGSLFVQNGRVTILAYAVGEKSFVDANGNNSYDAGETFYDLGDLFLDSNENGIWDSNPTQPDLLEQYIAYGTGTQACLTRPSGTALSADYATSPSKENTCNATWGLNYVRRSQTITLSGSSSQISKRRFNMGESCSGTFYFWLMDQNYNPMPAGTTVTTDSSTVSGTYTSISGGTLNTSSAAATVSVGGTPVIDTTHAGGTLVSLTVDGGTACTGAYTVDKYPAGTLNIVTNTQTAGLPINGTSIQVEVCNDSSLDSNCSP